VADAASGVTGRRRALAWLAAGLATLALAAAPARAHPIQDWVTYYYLDKDASQVVESLRDMAQDGALGAGPQEAPLASFFSEVFRASPQQAVGWIEAAQLDAESRKPLIKALWLAGLEDEAAKLARLDGWPKADLEKLRKPPPDRYSFRISDPSHLDMMWAAFMATGDSRYVLRVIDVLEYPVAPGEAGMPALLLRSSARWSLASNAFQHELVLRACRDEAARRSGSTREILLGVLEEVPQKAQSFPARDGEFSALLFVTDDLDFRGRWAALPIADAPDLSTVSRLPRGREAEVELVITGMGLDPGLNADVVWDLTVLRPDGTAYAEFKDVPALRGRRPTRYMVTLAEAAVRITFDPPDPAGVYTVRVVARDRVGNRKVELSTQLELAGD